LLPQARQARLRLKLLRLKLLRLKLPRLKLPRLKLPRPKPLRLTLANKPRRQKMTLPQSLLTRQT
jgi:hypothetical protein